MIVNKVTDLIGNTPLVELKNIEIDKLVSKKLIAKLSMEAKKILYYFAFFRHEISANILKTIVLILFLFYNFFIHNIPLFYLR